MKAKTKALLDQVGATKVKFYEIDETRVPFIGTVLTVCLLLGETGNVLSRGVSIKSILDSYNRKSGKDKSFRRALTALFKKSTGLPVNLERDNWKKYCRKIIKVKDFTDIKKVQDCDDALRFVYGFHDLPKFEISTKTVYKSGKEKQVAKIYLPRVLPLQIATQFGFNYKSVYHPELTNLEKDYLERTSPNCSNCEKPCC
jgi:hypothetical protein